MLAAKISNGIVTGVCPYVRLADIGYVSLPTTYRKPDRTFILAILKVIQHQHLCLIQLDTTEKIFSKSDKE